MFRRVANGQREQGRARPTYGIEFDSEASQFGRGRKMKETGAGSGTAQVGPMTWTSEEAPNLPCEED